MTPQEIARSPKRLSRAHLRTVRDHLRDAAEKTGSPHAYLFAHDGDRKVELRFEAGEFTRTPVDPGGRPIGPSQRPRLLSPAWALTALPALPVLGFLVERLV